MSAGTCRISTGPRRHHCSTWHAWLVESYRAARESWLDGAEAATSLYPTELADYAASHPPITFRTFLIGTCQAKDHPCAPFAD